MLSGKKVTVGETRLSKKQPLGDAEVEALLGSVDEVQIRTGQGPSGPGRGSSPF